MRQHMAYLSLRARGSFYKVLLILVAAVAAQVGLFLWSVQRVAARYGSYPISGPEAVFDSSHMIWVLGAAFLLITVALCLNGCQFGSKQDYTLRRLGISQQAQFFWQAGYNTFCYLLLWVVEVALVWVLCSWYVSGGHMTVTSHQTVFLTFYRSDLLHSLLPLSSVSRWMRNILLMPALGLAAARFPQMQRRGSFAVGILLLTIITLVCFYQPLDTVSADLFLLIPADFTLVYFLSTAFRKEVSHEKA